MADALVSIVLDRLASVIQQQFHHHISLVVGVESEIQSLTNTLQTVRAALADAEKRQAKDQLVRLWLERLKHIAYQMDDVVDEWSTAILKLQIEEIEIASMCKKKKVSSCFPSSCIPFKQVVKQVDSRRDIALKIQRVKQQLDVIANERIQFNFGSSDRRDESYRLITTSAIDISEVCGREVDEKTILNKLLGHESCELLVISIVGMGGIGKTTLAQLAYSHPEVKAHFNERIWVCVSDPFDPIRICRAILESLRKKSPKLRELEALQQEIQARIAGKKFLLVLDDVWTEDYQLLGQLKNCLKCGSQGSSILVTTRNEGVAKMMQTTYMHSLETLSEEQSLPLFNRIAFSGGNSDKIEELGEIGGKIASKCGGLPLAIKTIGSMLRTKDNKEEWESVLNSEVWQMDVIEKQLSPPLLLSYYDLPSPIKRCFSFCATFPKDAIIVKEDLIRLWMAHSYLNSKTSIDMETIGQDYFHFLVSRSLFQDCQRDEEGRVVRCKMHDIIHDLAQFLTKNECLMMRVEGVGKVRIEPPSEKGYHATLVGALNSSTHNMENLRTLLNWRGVQSSAPSDNVFQYLGCLRALDLSGHILGREALRGLGKLTHLRYLNLSKRWLLRDLPGEICGLCNLQTLDVSGCQQLERLPQGMRKLINLRHLVNKDTCFRLPKGIGRLTSLRTVSQLKLGNEDENACKIGELRNLNNLRGSIKVEWLGGVDGGEAEKAELKNKQHLHHLSLKNCGSKSVVEALQPHPNLKSLQICSYGDVEYPSWVMNSCLTHLKKLQLIGISHAKCMPPLGELPLIEILEINKLGCIEYIGDEFLGSSTTTAFPKLKTLSVSHMFKWKSWKMKGGGEEEKRSVMPRLHSLEMHCCPRLEALPDYLLCKTTLRELKIVDCTLLRQRYKKEEGGARGGEDRARISHIPNFVIQ